MRWRTTAWRLILCEGDFAIIDTTDCEPVNGELFLRRLSSGGHQVIEIGQYDTSRIRQVGGAPFTEPMWAAYWGTTIVSGDGAVERVRWVDGPCTTKNMTAYIVGKVIGLYQPDFRQQLRLAA